MKQALPQDFYFQDTAHVARKLLGKILCRRLDSGEILKGRIVELEAYLGVEDPAAHTFKGRRTARNQSMYLDGGHAYVYMIYGLHYCLNFVTRTHEHPEAVLIRALEPVPRPASLRRVDLATNGPGKLCRAFMINKEQDGLPLWKPRSSMWVQDAPDVPKAKVVTSTRIGVEYAGDAASWPLRFYERDNLFISKK